jgi:hypothetical protein
MIDDERVKTECLVPVSDADVGLRWSELNSSF